MLLVTQYNLHICSRVVGVDPACKPILRIDKEQKQLQPVDETAEGNETPGGGLLFRHGVEHTEYTCSVGLRFTML